MSARKISISSLAEYISSVRALRDAFAWEDEVIDPWFRGVRDADYKLLPSAYRGSAADWEIECRKEFRRRAYPYLEDQPIRPSSEWDWYFLMQHYGLPTRLLDWSESALSALYFAVESREAPLKTAAAVWVLDPFWLNAKVAGKRDWIFSVEEDEAKDYLKSPYQEQRLPGPPIAIEPVSNSRRLAAQRGTFTIHGADNRGLEDYDEMAERLVKIEVPGKSRAEIAADLRTAGVTPTSLFPELESLCKEIRDSWIYDRTR